MSRRGHGQRGHAGGVIGTEAAYEMYGPYVSYAGPRPDSPPGRSR